MDVNKNEGQERSMGILDKTKVYRFESQEDKALALANEPVINETTITSGYLHIRYHEDYKNWGWTNLDQYINKAILWQRPKLDPTKIYVFESAEERVAALASENASQYAKDVKHDDNYIYYNHEAQQWYADSEFNTKRINPDREIVHWNKPMYDHKNIYLFSCAKDCAEFAKKMAKTEKVCSLAQEKTADSFIGLLWSDCFDEWIAIENITTTELKKSIVVDMTGQKPTPCPIKPPMTNFEPLDPSICYEFDNEKHAVEFCRKYRDKVHFNANCLNNHGYNISQKMYLNYSSGYWYQYLDPHRKQIQQIHGLEWPNSTSQSRGEKMNTTEFTRKVRQAAESLVTATESSRPMEPMQNFGMRFTWAALWPVRILLRTVGVSALNGARTVFNAATFGGLCYGAYWLYNNVHIQF